MKNWQRKFTENVTWFAGALVLAFFVWYVATLQADPFVTRTFTAIPVIIDRADGLVITNTPSTDASIIITAQESVMNRLRREDIVIRADLMDLGPGVYTVPLRADVNRAVSVDDTRPTQITVELELVESGQKPVIIETTDPPVDITAEDPEISPLDVTVSGASSDVRSVVDVYGEVDLSEARSPIETLVTLIPRDENGRRVDGVTLDPATATVDVNLYRRDDVERLTVQPSLQLETSEEGYTLTTLRSEPTEIFVRGTSTALEALGDTVFTDAISLAGRTGNFEIEVPLNLRNDVIVLPSNDRTVTVYVGIEAQMGVLQLDGIPVDFLGLGQGLSSESSTDTISVVINGPRILLDSLTNEDVHAVVDLSGLQPGPHDVRPAVNLTRGQADVESIIPLPETLDIVITADATPADGADIDAEATASPTPTEDG